MPIVRVEMLAGRSQAVKDELAAELTACVARCLKSAPEHIYVMFSDVAHSDWAVAGRVMPTPPATPAKDG